MKKRKFRPILSSWSWALFVANAFYPIQCPRSHGLENQKKNQKPKISVILLSVFLRSATAIELCTPGIGYANQVTWGEFPLRCMDWLSAHGKSWKQLRMYRLCQSVKRAEIGIMTTGYFYFWWNFNGQMVENEGIGYGNRTDPIAYAIETLKK